MEKRYERWVGRGMPRSRRGRNIVIKNHVQSCAWYLVQSQTPPNLPQMLEKWQRYAWNLKKAENWFTHPGKTRRPSGVRRRWRARLI